MVKREQLSNMAQRLANGGSRKDGNYFKIRNMLTLHIKLAVCNFYDLVYDQNLLNNRKRPYSTCRHVIMYIMQRRCNMTLEAIGKAFTERGKPYSIATVERAVNKVIGLRKVDARFDEEIKQILKLIQ